MQNERKEINIAMEIDTLLYKITDDKEDYMQSDGMMNKIPGMQWDFKLKGNSYRVMLINFD